MILKWAGESSLVRYPENFRQNDQEIQKRCHFERSEKSSAFGAPSNQKISRCARNDKKQVNR